jgi:hypothetical protein
MPARATGRLGTMEEITPRFIETEFGKFEPRLP